MNALDRIAGWLFCGACLRIRVSPVHIVTRLLGVCPGDRGHNSWG